MPAGRCLGGSVIADKGPASCVVKLPAAWDTQQLGKIFRFGTGIIVAVGRLCQVPIGSSTFPLRPFRGLKYGSLGPWNRPRVGWKAAAFPNGAIRGISGGWSLCTINSQELPANGAMLLFIKIIRPHQGAALAKKRSPYEPFRILGASRSHAVRLE